MSGGPACSCPERDEPITVEAGSNRPARLWVILSYMCNHSAFNGYHMTSSEYSAVGCRRCGYIWRTKAKYVDDLGFADGWPQRDYRMSAEELTGVGR